MTLHATRLQVADASVTVASTTMAVTDWSRRYFGPWWNATDVPASVNHGTPVISAEIAPGRFTELAQEVLEAPNETTSFAKAVTIVSRDDRGVITAVSPEEGIAYRSDPDTGHLSIFGTQTEPVALATARLAREAVRGRLLQDGWTVLHASAAVRDDQAVLTFGPKGAGKTTTALGPKGAGKTTTALTLARRPEWELLANDHVFIRHETEGLRVLPWPSATAIGLGLLDALGWFDIARERLNAGDSLHPTQDTRVTDALLAGRREPLWDQGRELKAQVFPDQFYGWFTLSLATSGYASTLLFPQVIADATPAVAEHERSLGDKDFMSGATEDRYPDLFNLAGGIDGGSRAEARTDVAKRIGQLPHHSVVLGRDVDANAQFLAKTLSRS